ncbi:helix-turn-helix domain-containing protein, partial [Klebsiella pneumoniae]|uniref:helix-turn-helix domain-containing protein n=1 Tax=Klebsiella pneumoniae TaxID=573 RepID=UPI001F373CC5
MTNKTIQKAIDIAGSQKKLADLCGVAQPTIWRLVSGNARGSTKIVEIANALGVRSEWLSTGNGPMRD